MMELKENSDPSLFSQMAPSMKVSGSKDLNLEMEEGYYYGQMVMHAIKVNSNETEDLEKENRFLIMECIEDNGRMIKGVEKEYKY